MNDAAVNLVLLPGMHGSARLFPPLIDAFPETWTHRVIEMPLDALHTHDEWAAIIREQLPREEPFTIIAESFSGPTAVKIAADPPLNLQAIVLAGTFLSNPAAPIPAWLVRLLKPTLLLRPPKSLIRRYLLGRDSSPELISAVNQTVEEIPTATIAHRIITCCEVDVRETYQRLKIPVLALNALQERLISRSCAQEFRSLRPDAKVIDLEAPHLLLESAPREAVSAIAEFLATLNRAAPVT